MVNLFVTGIRGRCWVRPVGPGEHRNRMSTATILHSLCAGIDEFSFAVCIMYGRELPCAIEVTTLYIKGPLWSSRVCLYERANYGPRTRIAAITH